MRFKYTPRWSDGSWHVEADMRPYRSTDNYTEPTNDECYCAGYNIVTTAGFDIVGIEGIIPGDQAAYDARLMAAAPQLAEALYNVTSLLELFAGNNEPIRVAIEEANSVLCHILKEEDDTSYES